MRESVTIFGGGFGYDKLKSISLNMGNSGTCTRLITGTTCVQSNCF